MEWRFAHPSNTESYADGRVSSWYNHLCQTGQRVGARRNVVPGSPRWGLGVGLMTPQWNNLQLRNHGEGQDPEMVVAAVKKKKKWNFVCRMWNVRTLLSVYCVFTCILKLRQESLKESPLWSSSTSWPDWRYQLHWLVAEKCAQLWFGEAAILATFPLQWTRTVSGDSDEWYVVKCSPLGSL